ncbi:MAG: NAD(P)/FAD-dependent oxidoreductase [Candidatus Magasanikbacteria bacterium]
MKVAVIGAGAAGMMCAATINELNPDIEVVLIEKNDTLGKKVLISGGGRCNVTTGIEDPKTVLENYPRGSKFLISAIHNFSPLAVRGWFESHGVPLKCEKDLRVFPVSNNSQDVVDVFKKIFVKNNTKILFKHTADSIEKTATGFIINFDNKTSLLVDKIVLALGGQAYRKTGSNGDGYSLAESLGHTITQLAPSLHSFITAEKWPGTLAGMSFAKATITADCAKPNSRTGSFLFTHSGISGPAVFALSALVAFTFVGQKKPLKIFIDFLPDNTVEEVKKTLQTIAMANPKKIFKNTLHHFLPLNLCEALCEYSKLFGNKRNAEVSKTDISLAATLLKKVPLVAIGRGSADEFVTAGGVELKEIDPKTMESKICLGLYFAGEIMDIDGFTGGFNLQAAWATGHAVGEKIVHSY